MGELNLVVLYGSHVHERLQFQVNMKSSDIVRHAMQFEIKRARQLLSQGMHDPTTMETLDALNQTLKLVTHFEMKILSDLDVE